MVDEWECLQRQVDELEALQSVFPEPGAFELAPAEEAALRFAQHLLEHVKRTAGSAGRNVNVHKADQADITVDGGSDEYGTQDVSAAGAAGMASPQDVGSLSGTVWLPDAQVCGSRVGLRFVLPVHYPQLPPQLMVQCAGPRAIHDALSAAVHACMEEAAGGECLVMAAHALMEAAAAVPDDTVHADSSSPQRTRSPNILASLIWFHHIKSMEKRKRMVEWARELQLAGGCKPGFPGVVVVEGQEEDVREFVVRVRSMPWQAMQVRGEDLLQAKMGSDSQGPSAPARRLHGPRGPWVFCEYEEEGGLGQLGALCRGAKLEDLFMTALKL